MSLIVNEIFMSIDGEGKTAGMLTTFVRLAGCNLRCSWCDTAYAMKKTQGTRMEVQDIVEQIRTHAVTLTGGEPLHQADALDLVDALTARGFAVNVETNGSKSIARLLDTSNPSKLIVTMDWKLSSSGMEHAMLESNLPLLRKRDVLKLVIGSRQDITRAHDIIKNSELACKVYLSPVFGAINPQELVEAVKLWHFEGMDMSRIRVQLQLHKFIWNPERRGV